MQYFKPRAGMYNLHFWDRFRNVRVKLTFAESRMIHKLKDSFGISTMRREATEADRVKLSGQY